jgi:hypothetical protein
MKEDEIMSKETRGNYRPGNKSYAGKMVRFSKSGDIYKVGEGGNLINPRKGLSKKARRKLEGKKR